MPSIRSETITAIEVAHLIDLATVATFAETYAKLRIYPPSIVLLAVSMITRKHDSSAYLTSPTFTEFAEDYHAYFKVDNPDA